METLTFEEMSIFFTKVETCLNSRLQQIMSDDPDNFTVLTSRHFGKLLNAISEPLQESEHGNCLNLWRYLQQM